MTARPDVPSRLNDRLPLVIGTTGHRDPRPGDIETLENHVRAVIANLRRDYLDNDPETPIVLLSALAEGADRVVARVALEQGVVLVAPLPMPMAEYRRDFEPGRGLADNAAIEFDELYARAFVKPEMPFTVGNSPAAVQADDDKRAEQYREVGLYIARHCHVLLALWNGDDNRKPGGTADIVACKREGIPLSETHSARAALDGSEIGPVIHIVTPRSGQTGIAVATKPWGRAIAETPDKSLWAYCLNGARAFIDAISGKPHVKTSTEPAEAERERRTWEVFDAIAGLTARFNREAAELGHAAGGALRDSIEDLFKPAGSRDFIVPALDRARAAVPRWCNLYQLADALARVRQTKFWADWKFLFAVGFIAIVFFEVFGHLFHHTDWLLVAYVVLFLSVFAWFLIAAWAQHQERFLDYRALAEVLRIAVFWKLLGIRTDVAEAYPIKQPNELAWVKITLRTLEMLDGIEPPRPKGRVLDPQAEQWVRTLWVDGQQAYFRRQGAKHDRRAERLERLSFVFAVLSPVLAIVLIGLDFQYGHDAAHAAGGFDSFRPGLMFAIGLSAAVAAACAGYNEKLAFKAQARQYDRMEGLFARALDLLEKPGAAPHAEKLYCELGAEAMKETAEWVAIYRQRPIRPGAG